MYEKILNFFGAKSGRVLLLRLMGRIHCAIPVAILYAAVCTLFQGDQVVLPAFCRGMLFAIPAALSFYAGERLPNLWQFLLASLLISGLFWLLLGNVAGLALGGTLCFFRGRARLQEVKEESFFDMPHWLMLLLFPFPFLFSAALKLPTLQRLSGFCAAFYLLLWLCFLGVSRIEEYIELNRGMSNLPAKRINRTGGVALAVFFLIASALLLPVAWNTFGDIQIDLEKLNQRPHVTYEMEEMPPQENMGTDFSELLGLENTEPLFQIPPFVSYLFYALCVGGVVALALYGIYRVFRSFRSSFTDSRDVVQFLSGRDEDGKEYFQEGSRGKRPSFLDRSPNALVRRRYRRTILKAAKEQPKRWNTPEEIEREAGVSQQTLHELYEKARYSPEGCSQTEVRALKNL